MSRLDELIKELCPDGVEFKTLIEIFNIRNGYTPSKSKAEYWENGTIPWFRMEDIRENGRILSTAIQKVTAEAVKNKPFPANSIIISTSATIGEHALINVNFMCNQRFTCLSLKDEYKDKYNIMFIFYYCFKLSAYCLENLNQGNFASVDMTKFNNFLIPLPPLEVQAEIVHILDNFTEYIEVLNAELSARRRQYEYYRDMLLDFDDVHGGGTVEVEWRTLGEVAKFMYGFTDKSKDNGQARYLRITDISDYGYLLNNEKKYINITEENKKYLVNTGDLLVARTGASYGKTLYFSGNEQAVFASFLIKILLDNSIILNKYYWHFSKSNLYWQQAEKLVSKGGQQQFNTSAISKIEIPIPPIAEQERIVAILDKFDSLCNDLTQGLPAEIEKRRKQYEYFRDKLLSFREV